MQLMGPRLQEGELPADNCDCRDPIKKFLLPVKHNIEGKGKPSRLCDIGNIMR